MLVPKQNGVYPHGQSGVAIPMDVVQPLELAICLIPSTSPVSISFPDFVLTSEVDCVVSFGRAEPLVTEGSQPLQMMLWAGERATVRAPQGASELKVAPLITGEQGKLYVQYIQPWTAVGDLLR